MSTVRKLTAPEQVRGLVAAQQDQAPGTLVLVDPSQVRRPWTSTLRTVVQGLLAFAVIAPLITSTLGLDPGSLPWLGAILAGLAGFARVMALPEVETFLRRFLPFLAAGGLVQPEPPRHRADT